MYKRQTLNTPRNLQQAGDRDHLDTMCDETPRTRQPILARFNRSWVCGNRPRTALVISTSREVNEARGGLILAAGRVRSKGKKKRLKDPVPPKTHHEIHSSPATATNSRRRATKHVPHRSAYSPASIDPECVKIGTIQLSQSVKMANVTNTHTY